MISLIVLVRMERDIYPKMNEKVSSFDQIYSDLGKDLLLEINFIWKVVS